MRVHGGKPPENEEGRSPSVLALTLAHRRPEYLVEMVDFQVENT